MAGIISSVVQSGLPEHQDSAQYRAGRFHNLVAGLSGVAILKVTKMRLTATRLTGSGMVAADVMPMTNNTRSRSCKQ
ncbi:hypothetical protein JD504_05760 [Aeromonas hydrophila]|uniref:hypothetical protein n=1 Tax=Aeromonas hydrophila TaxID=644 RepID=UPI00191EB9F4|nr:hypothetical protein [Aeromonas hydrophila]MBL0559415.1 hypothetical protein [Aeromonas hydrophila]MBL0670259.1 hypothetical protein [Aeromonas hydrophila]